MGWRVRRNNGERAGETPALRVSGRTLDRETGLRCASAMDEAKSAGRQVMLWVITVALLALAGYMYFHR